MVQYKIWFIVDNLKAIEIEKCKKDISELKTQLYNNTKKLVDYNSLRSVYIGPFNQI